MIKNFEIGDRVRMVHNADSFGVVVSNVEASPVDGGPRQAVKWDRSGKVTPWNPIFYMPEKSSPQDDPEMVASGDLVSYKSPRIQILKKGIVISHPAGMQRKTANA